MPRAVVAGGAGFLGSHLCDRLIELGYDVLCLDDLCTGAEANLEHLAASKQFTFQQHNIVEPLDLDGPVNAIFDLASPASPVDFPRIPIHILETGTTGTNNLLKMAKDKGARFLLASTSEVYGDPEVHPQPESYWGNVNPIGPRSVYDEAKRASEAFASAYHRANSVDIRIVRIFNTYGPRMRRDDGRVIPAFISQALENSPLTVFGDGSQTRSLCYVDDLIDGILALANAPVTEPVNIGNPAEISMLALADEVKRLTGSQSAVRFERLPVDDPKRRQPDISKAKLLLGWEPKVELEEGLRRTIDWWRSGEGFAISGASDHVRTTH